MERSEYRCEPRAVTSAVTLIGRSAPQAEAIDTSRGRYESRAAVIGMPMGRYEPRSAAESGILMGRFGPQAEVIGPMGRCGPRTAAAGTFMGRSEPQAAAIGMPMGRYEPRAAAAGAWRRSEPRATVAGVPMGANGYSNESTELLIEAVTYKAELSYIIELLSAGANPNVCNSENIPIVQLAYTLNSVATGDLLLEWGARL